MTDAGFAISDLSGIGSARPAGERGSLRITDTAVAHAVEGAARTAPGSVAHAGALHGLGGHAYPHAKVTVRHGRIWARLDVAVRWPGPTAAASRAITGHVRSETVRITGMDVAALDVTVHLVEAPEATGRSLA